MARIWEIAKPEHGRLLLSVVLAVLGVVSGIVPFVSAARAILKDAPIIILDEATANVDPENEDKLIAAFNALTENKTVIMIAHRLKTIRNADQIVVLDGGTISSGTHEELLRTSEKYSGFIKLREEAAGWKMQSA